MKEHCFLLDVNKAAELLKMSKSSLYKLTSKRMIPFLKPSRRIFFCKQDLKDWLKQSYQPIIENLKN